MAFDLIYCRNTWLLMFLMPLQSICVCVCVMYDMCVCVCTSLCSLKKYVLEAGQLCKYKSLASTKLDKEPESVEINALYNISPKHLARWEGSQ